MGDMLDLPILIVVNCKWKLVRFVTFMSYTDVSGKRYCTPSVNC